MVIVRPRPPETTDKFIAAKVEHETAGPVDGYVAPQLHTHAVVFNITDATTASLFASQQFGAPEIKGYTQEYLDASSPRSRQNLERRAAAGKEAAELAAHSTRDHKEILSLGEAVVDERMLIRDGVRRNGRDHPRAGPHQS